MYTPPSKLLVEYLQRLYDNGMTTTSGGNLSIKDSDGAIWITPAGIDKGTLRPIDIMKVLADGTVVGLHKPSSEFPFHRHIYKARPGVRAVLHAHAPAIVAFSCVRRIPNVKLVPGAAELCGKVEFAPYAIPGSEALGDMIAAQIEKGADSVVMENHGAVVCGDSIEQCFQRYEALDYVARIELAVAGLGDVFPLSGAKAPAKWPQFKPGEPSSLECELRDSLAAFHARCYRQGLFYSGNAFIAARLGDDDFLATAANTDALHACPCSFVRIKDGAREAGKTPAFPAAFAREVFKAAPWAGSVYLTRSSNITAFAATGKPFDSRTIPESYILLRDVETVKAADFYADPAAVAAKLTPRSPALLIESVGLVTVGKTILEGFDRMEVAEFTAKCLLLASRIGTLSPITKPQVNALVKAFKLPK